MSRKKLRNRPKVVKYRKPFLETAYEKFLESVLTDVFDATDAMDMPNSQLAKDAELSTATVYNLYHRYTKWPRMSTVYKMAAAVGMTAKFLKEEQKKIFKVKRA
jgi:DNA-binding phage protein